MNNWIVGSVTLLACLLCQVFAKGFLRSLSILVGLIEGYIIACFMGMVDFSRIASQSIISLPKLLPFSPEFNIGAILSVIAVYLVSATETIGDTSALCNSALKRNPNESEMGAAISCDGFVSSVSGLFDCTPITSFSQNVGLGFTQATEMFRIFPEIVRTVFAENCVAVVFLLAVMLNLLLPKKDIEM